MYEELAAEIEEEMEYGKWFQEQMDAIQERCTYCIKDKKTRRASCWKHNPDLCAFCNANKCTRHDVHGRWKQDMNAILSGAWGAKVKKEENP